MTVSKGLAVALSAALLAAAAARPAGAADAPASHPVRTQKLAPHLWYLYDRGGNMAALIGKDGTFLVDDEFAPFVPAILDKLKALGGGTPKFVVNTHYHQDHTGGNERMHAAGATVIAQANVRARLAQIQRAPFGGSTLAPVPASALPTLTFEHAITLNFDGETIRVLHLPPGHTDGDSVVFFEQANVVHMGDLFFNGLYPIIDVQAGGSVGGMIADIDRVLPRMNDKTVVVPGHGPVADKAALIRFRNMMATVRDKVRTLVDQGKTLAQIQAAHPTAEFDARWGNRVPAKRFVAEVYYSLKPHFVGS